MKRVLPAALCATLFTVAPYAIADIIIKGKNEQDVKVQGAVVNVATGAGATARQSLASNVGNVTIGGDNKQTVDVKGAVVNVAAGAMTKAEQALGSNVSK